MKSGTVPLAAYTAIFMLCIAGCPAADSHPSGGAGNSGPSPIYAPPVAVRGYIKADGTYVQPYLRSAPDNNIYNNYSTSGNYNPYTGQIGAKDPLSAGRYLPMGYDYFDPVGSAMRTWLGVPSTILLAQLGKPYKTHKTDDGESLEYKNGNMRLEYFLDESGVVVRWKYWAYDGLGGRL